MSGRAARVALPVAGLVLVAMAAADMPIGFVSHFPLVRHDDAAVPETRANVLIVRAPWSLIEPKEGQFDFSILDQQLEWADRHGMKLVWVLEAGPTHAATVPWLVKKLQAAHQTMVDQAGNPVRDPSMFSPMYRRYLAQYISRVIGYLSSNRLRHVVYGYDNGCEWWYQLTNSYGPLDVAAFRDYLRERYGTVAALNPAWGAHVASFDAVTPPKLASEAMGGTSQGYLSPASTALDAAYCTNDDSHVAVKPGEHVTLEVDVTTRGMISGSASAQIAWLGPTDPHPISVSRASPFYVRDGSGTIKIEATVPAGATRAWLLAKANGVGRFTFHRISLTDETGKQLSPNPGLDPKLGAWHFIVWTAGEKDRVTSGWPATGDAWVSYEPRRGLGSGAKWPLAEVYDWTSFRADALARFIDWFAARIKDADPRRPVISYLTFAFANPFEWDYVTAMGVSVDRVAALGHHTDVLGMQLASADGDYDSVACALDLAHKYGKPTWAVDLLDFSRGMGLGAEGLTRTSLSVVQHGGDGIEYYCWWGTPVYNYDSLGVPALRGMIGRTRRAKEQLGAMKPERHVALVMPRMPLYRFLDEPANDWADFMGWYKLLSRMGVGVDVYTLEDLPGADLSRYRAVVVPDCAYISAEGLSAIARAAKAGRRVLTSGRFADRDMTGRPMSATARQFPRTAFSREIGATVLGQTFRYPSPTDTPSRLVCRKGSPRFPADVVAEVAARLREAGVDVLADPSKAPVTIVPFVGDGHEAAFVLPVKHWSGTVTVGGHRVSVGPLGKIVDLGVGR